MSVVLLIDSAEVNSTAGRLPVFNIDNLLLQWCHFYVFILVSSFM